MVLGGRLEEGKHGVGAPLSSSVHVGTDSAAGTGAIVGTASQLGGYLQQASGRQGSRDADGAEAKLYSDSDSNSDGEAGGEGEMDENGDCGIGEDGGGGDEDFGAGDGDNHAGLPSATWSTHDAEKGDNVNLSEERFEAEGEEKEEEGAVGAPLGGDVDDHIAGSTAPDDEHHHSWPLSPRGGVEWAETSSSEESGSPSSARADATTGECAVDGFDSPVAHTRHLPVSDLSEALAPDDAIGAGSTAVGLADASDSTSLSGRYEDASINHAPSKRIFWRGDGNDFGDGVGRNTRQGVQEEHTAGASRYSSVSVDGVFPENEVEGHVSVDTGREDQQELCEGGNSQPFGVLLNSSAESGGGAAALAASGVFDITGTSGEVDDDEEEEEEEEKEEQEEEGEEELSEQDVSVGDADSLEGLRAREGAWMPPQHPTCEQKGCQAVTAGAGGRVLTDDARGLVDELMRQVVHCFAAGIFCMALRPRLLRVAFLIPRGLSLVCELQ